MKKAVKENLLIILILVLGFAMAGLLFKLYVLDGAHGSVDTQNPHKTSVGTVTK